MSSPATKLAYEKRYISLHARYYKETNIKAGSPQKIGGFVNWLLAKRDDLRPATWRQYRAAVYFMLKKEFPTELWPKLDKILAPLKAIDPKETKQARKFLSPRTSAKKLKTFVAEDQNAIFTHLSKKGGKNSKPLKLYLKAGLLTGLRPVEWQDTTIFCEAPLTLCVRNAKHDEIRGNGEFRYLEFADIDDAAGADLRAWLACVEKAGPDYPTLQGRLADALHHVTKTIWPRRKKNVTMYSTRHEFAAVAKLFLHDKPDAAAILAALMGHASDVTASNHYGRYSGQKMPLSEYLQKAAERLPNARAKEVASVRRKREKKMEFLEDFRGAPRVAL